MPAPSLPPAKWVMPAFFNSIAGLGRQHPRARRGLAALDVIRDVPYGPLPEHRLDIYRSRAPGPSPAVLYLHGGAFQILSKDTHWLMGLTFARMGGTVFVPNYRLAPRNPYPAALEDACLAALWVQANAARFGADSGRLVLAGESAGANLACGVAVAASWRRPEAFAAAIFDAQLQPALLFPACGMLQVTEPKRLTARNPTLGRFVADRIQEASVGYLCGQTGALADPLCVLETAGPPERPFPPTFAAVGTRDPLLDDTRRLGHALTRLGVHAEVRYYPGEVHAFHAFYFRPAARRCWRDHGAFWQRYLPPPTPASGSAPAQTA